MATQNITSGTGFQYAPAGPVFLLKEVVDFSQFTGAASDVLQVLNVPADTLVLRVHLKVLTASGGTLTGSVGDGTAPAGFLTTPDLNAATDVLSVLALTEAAPNTVTGLTNGKFYAAADTIDVTLSANAPGVVGKFIVEAVCVQLSSAA